ncbi:MAG: electron transport complex subunit RsxC [Lachnospiraceae bacterium]|nr:electron transport complex subunit RsxC [Lachnospiraceae bacterium]
MKKERKGLNKDRLDLPKKPFKTRGGAKAPHRKNTLDCKSVTMPCPQQVILPVSQHIGAPCKPVVKAGTVVGIGDVVAESGGFVSSPIHATVSGKVSKITQIKHTNGSMVDAIVIESDGEMRVSENVKPPVVNNAEELIAAVKNSGLVGLGGAGFPTHVKLSVPDGKKADTLIINCAECEPYITVDNREAIENSDNVLNGVFTVMRLLKLERGIIGIEDNKPEAIKILKKLIKESKEKEAKNVCVLPLKARYPQGAEKVLIKACTGRVVPVGKLPIDTGCIVMNITSVAFLSSYLKTGIPLVSKRLTVDGSAVAEPKNVIVPIGTAVKDIIEFCGGYSEKPGKIISGGPMMGIALANDDVPIMKQNNAILAFTERDAVIQKTTDCIRCGRCVQSCPMGLVPTAIAGAVKRKDTDELNRQGVMVCMECGSCAFNCPAHRPIVQTMRMGKALVKSAPKK